MTQNQEVQGARNALMLVLAVAEEDWTTYNQLAAKIGRHPNPAVGNKTVLAMAAIAANAVKEAYPDGWGAHLRLSLHDLDLDPNAWTNEDSK